MRFARRFSLCVRANGLQRPRLRGQGWGNQLVMQPDPADFLYAGEIAVPEAVKDTILFFEERDLWFRLSRNRPALSCKDAARKRRRLGAVGIPLWDEMKSFFGGLPDGESIGSYVMVHCRGDRLLDFTRLARVMGTPRPPRRLSGEELKVFGQEYGLVNPFEPGQSFSLDGRVFQAAVTHVFDEDLLHLIGEPGTVMTNAGDVTWAVEFSASDLFLAMRRQPVGPPGLVLNGDITAGPPPSRLELW